nr:MAG TPA: hypothetical protein [Caudoviricetes sp.]
MLIDKLHRPIPVFVNHNFSVIEISSIRAGINDLIANNLCALI